MLVSRVAQKLNQEGGERQISRRFGGEQYLAEVNAFIRSLVEFVLIIFDDLLALLCLGSSWLGLLRRRFGGGFGGRCTLRKDGMRSWPPAWFIKDELPCASCCYFRRPRRPQQCHRPSPRLRPKIDLIRYSELRRR